jgi:hypothetical protein
VDGDDGPPGESIGEWAEEKIFDVKEYVKLSRGARRKLLGWSGEQSPLGRLHSAVRHSAL